MSGWIPVSERLPRREDADERGAVVWKWANGDTMTGGWDEIEMTGSDDPVRWSPLPPYSPPAPTIRRVWVDARDPNRTAFLHSAPFPGYFQFVEVAPLVEAVKSMDSYYIDSKHCVPLADVVKLIEGPAGRGDL